MDLGFDDVTKDLEIVDGDVPLITGQQAVQQFLNSRLKMFLGEWFLDETKGIPYLDKILVKNPNPIAVDAIFKTEILNSPGVMELLSYKSEINFTLRKAKISFVARSQDGGLIEFDETVGG